MLAYAINGDLLSTNAPRVREQLSQLTDSSPSFDVLEIDLRSAAMVDSVGLNLLVWAWKSVRPKGAVLRVRITSADVERTFRFTRLNSYIEVLKS